MYVSKPFSPNTKAKKVRGPAWHPIKEKYISPSAKTVTAICGIVYTLGEPTQLVKKLKKGDYLCGTCSNRLQGKRGSLSVWSSTGYVNRCGG